VATAQTHNNFVSLNVKISCKSSCLML